ncbi:helix-turn-helix transcriptional regulator [Sinorhizobium sp. NFACC03]|uniref:helix-turn-helix domain-containing protein n=1 Tax=Sinorhizobium sp. NFACC03 TaxID=1566295 RepID=UPI003369C933
MNQPLLADALGVDQATVSRWKNGKSKPSRPVLKLIERLLEDRRSAVRSVEVDE